MTDPDGSARAALIAEATKKAAVVWLSVHDRPAYPVWCMPAATSLYVVTGPGEQPAPGLAGAATVRVSARGDHRGLIMTWTASVERIAPGGEAWDANARPLAAKRLNAAGTTDAVVDRWARECTIYKLDPTGEDVGTGPRD